MNEVTKNIKALAHWLWLRKNTTPVHWLYGLFSAFLIYPSGILAGWGSMVAFAGLEYWNDKETMHQDPDHHPEGASDWWEAFVPFCIGWGVLALLDSLQKVVIGWY